MNPLLASSGSIAPLRGGRIEIILGPMFSGKSTELLRRIRRFTVAKMKCLVIKSKLDTRYSEECMSTHDKQTWKAEAADCLMDKKKEALEAEIIGIDEGQFFTDIVPFCEEMANLGKIVIVAALDGTYERKKFGTVIELIPLCESIIKLNGVCSNCYADSSFSFRIVDEEATVVVASDDKYTSVCRRCFHIKTTEKNKTISEKLLQKPVSETANFFWSD